MKGPASDRGGGENSVVKDIGDVLRFLESLGFSNLPIQTPPPTGGTASTEAPIPPTPARTAPPASTSHAGRVAHGSKAKALKALQEEIGDCKRCGLSEERKTVVFGEGNPAARIVFIGEAPGREEDRQGRPFVGEAGKLLTRLIDRMGEDEGFKRPDVYIGNIIKCRPPSNRDPLPEEIATCVGFIKRQIEIIKPDAIMSLGRISAQTLLETETPIGKLRGKLFHLGGIPLIPTYHPAYLLRNRKAMWLVWKDAERLLKELKP